MIKEIARVLKHRGIYLGNKEFHMALSPQTKRSRPPIVKGFNLIPNDLVTIYQKS